MAWSAEPRYLRCLACKTPILQDRYGICVEICSDRCRKQRAIDLGHATPLIVKVCKKCGREFTGLGNSYCSAECRPPKPPPRPRLTVEQRRERDTAKKHAAWLQQKAARQIIQPYLDFINPIKFCAHCKEVIPRSSRRTKFCNEGCSRSHRSRHYMNGPSFRKQRLRWSRSSYHRFRERGYTRAYPHVCITCFRDTGRRLFYCSDMCIHQRKNPNRERRGRDTKEMKAKRAFKIEAESQAGLEIIEELKDERSAISRFIKAIGFDPGQSGQASGSLDSN